MPDPGLLQHKDSLFAQILEGGPRSLWVLVDPTFCPAGSDPTTDDWLARACSHVQPAIPGYEMLAKFNPLWLGLDLSSEAGCALLEETVEYARFELHPAQLAQGLGRRVCAWVRARDGAVAAQAMARLLVQRRADGQRALLRLYDPAVLWGMWATLDGVQHRGWMRACEQWWLLKPDGETMALRDGMARAHDPGTSGTAPWAALQLTAAQWGDFEAMAPFHAALRDWLAVRGRGDTDARRPPLDDLRDSALRAMQAVRRRPGAVDIDDQIAAAFDVFVRGMQSERAPVSSFT